MAFILNVKSVKRSFNHLFRRYSTSKEPLPFLSSPARDYKYLDVNALGRPRIPFYSIMISTSLLAVLGYFCFFVDDGSDNSNGSDTPNEGKNATEDEGKSSNSSSDEKEAKSSTKT